MWNKDDPCDPKHNNGIACTCATYVGFAFSIAEFLLYFVAIVLFILKNKFNENKKGIYAVMLITFTALLIHAGQTFSICTH